MLPGRKLAHLEGVRFDGLNRYQWWTYLTAKEDWDYAPSRRQRWKDTWSWMLDKQYRTWGEPFHTGHPFVWGEPFQL